MSIQAGIIIMVHINSSLICSSKVSSLVAWINARQICAMTMHCLEVNFMGHDDIVRYGDVGIY